VHAIGPDARGVLAMEVGVMLGGVLWLVLAATLVQIAEGWVARRRLVDGMRATILLDSLYAQPRLVVATTSVALGVTAAAAIVGTRALTLALAAAAFAGLNGVGHLVLVVARGCYVPGVVLGVAALVPLALTAYVVALVDERPEAWPTLLASLLIGAVWLALPLAAARLTAGGEVAPSPPERRFNRYLRWAAIAAGVPLVLVATVAVVEGVARASTDDSLAARGLAWGEADILDWTRFPARPIRATTNPVDQITVTLPRDERLASVPVLRNGRRVARPLDDVLRESGTVAFLVFRDGRLVDERYFHGYDRDATVTSFSVAKSFNSAMVGIAIEDGLIGGVNDPVTRYVPELLKRDPRFSRVTLRHLLSMSSGLRYEESDVPWKDDGALTYEAPNLRKAALEQTQVVTSPGRRFLYNNFNPLLIGLVLERATGMSVSRYLETRIWRPLGMVTDGSWSLDSRASGFEKMESGLNGRAIDLARLGLLYLNRGRWHGRQLVPQAWVAASTARGTTRDPAPFYALGWWTPAVSDPGAFVAEGNFGQYLYVSPTHRVVVARFGTGYGYGHRMVGDLSGSWAELLAEIAARA
jgi:CubicO group peptidase (beta-lactamase class C family)